MNAQFDVIDDTVVYVQDGAIVAVRPPSATAPAGFETTAALSTDGSIYPGLIELHNHLAYDALPLWQVPKLYKDRDQWRGTTDYETLISRPMGILGAMPDVVRAICRYVECKAVVGGTTTSQGIRLVSDAGIGKYFRGIIRTVEQPGGDKRLPAAAALISDPDAKDPKAFWRILQKQDKKGAEYLLHLSEGTDDSARKHFRSLEIAPDTWAIDRALAGIHCAALTAADFDVLAAHQGAMVWSPFSNLLLYGKTADVAAAKKAGVAIGIGPDWSPSGSKNLFGELKVAKLWNDDDPKGGCFTSRDLVAMATIGAAAILRWDQGLGSISPGKRADLLVVATSAADPYDGLLAAKEADIRLVVVDGVPRYGVPALMSAFRADGETATVAGAARVFNLKDAPEDPAMDAVSFASATSTLADALQRLPQSQVGVALRAAEPLPAKSAVSSGWTLALDELRDTKFELRPRLPLRGTKAFTGPAKQTAALAAKPIVLKSIRLDPVTVADDPVFRNSVPAQKNLPAYLQSGLVGRF
jgi:hypothetical protein